VGDKVALTPKKVREALKAVGAKPIDDQVRISNTEPTSIVRLQEPLTPDQGERLSKILKQEAIAQRAGDSGTLFGPKADEWGPFNPDYFLEPDDVVAALSQKARDNLAQIRMSSPEHSALVDTILKYLTPVSRVG